MDIEDKQIQDILNRIKVSDQVAEIGEEMRSDILSELHHRIDVSSRRLFVLKVMSAVASVVLLLGISNYVAFRAGYKRINSQVIEMVNPLGLKSSVVLSDGTKVTLNAGTRLSYPNAFVSGKREVAVSGEAFFEVAHDDKSPFIVKAENLNVCVLGTKFNVKAYREEDNIEITLTEGRVGVELNSNEQQEMVYLKPGQQLLFDKSHLSFHKHRVNLNYYISWKEGKFYFNSLTFQEIATRLERSFNVHIDITSPELKEIVFTGDFVRGENLEQILRVMTTDRRTRYNIEGDQVRIYKR